MQKQPKFIGIETINTCNARCPFCPLFQGESMMSRERRPAKIMEQQMFENILREIRELKLNPHALYLNMNGEPLQDPLFVERLKAVAAAGMAHLIDLQTNAHFLNSGTARSILGAGIGRLTVGFDGATKETYERHRVRCDYDRVLGNLRHFVALRNELVAPTRIAIQFVRTRENDHEVAAAYAMFQSFLDPDRDVFQDNFSKDWGDRPGRPDYFVRSKEIRDTQVRGCTFATEQLIIHSDGTVAACCWDYNLTVSDGGLGNVNSGGVAGVLNGARRKTLSERLLTHRTDDKPEKCQSCMFMYDVKMPPLDDARISNPELIEASEYGFTYKFPKQTERRST
jgi:radical SAM protein with 4Fe4S-binding SPASM domain